MNMVGGKQISSKRFNKPCILLIFIAGMERFAFKGVASNLVTYLTDVVKMSNSSAAKTVNSWCGFTSIMPLLVASFADSYWDQYLTILASSFLYVLGLVALTSTALAWAWVPRGPDSSTSALYWSLGLISLGLGGYNPSLQAFAADQVEAQDELPCTKDDSLSKGKKTLFFQWWYFGICSGSLLGVSLMSYIQDSIGWGLGFSIPAVVMVVSIVFFACGSRFYAYKQDKYFQNRPLEGLIRAIKSSAAKMMNCGITLPSKESHANELELEEKPLCPQNFDGTEVLENRTSQIHLIENVKVILRLLPIWTMLLTFAIIFQQPATFFTKQGMTMKRNIGSNFKIPPATLQSAITFSIILLMPLYDKVLIPIARLITRNEKGISVMQRMGIGMVLSIIAMAIAAIVESTRLKMSSELTTHDVQQGIPVPLSIFWLLPQYILLGVSDIFTVVGMQEYFYSEVPVRMKTMGIALYTSVFGVGSFVSVLLISIIESFTSSEGQNHGWFSDDMREARLDNYYWVLTLLSAISLLLYIALCRFYRCRDSLDEEGCKRTPV